MRAHHFALPNDARTSEPVQRFVLAGIRRLGSDPFQQVKTSLRLLQPERTLNAQLKAADTAAIPLIVTKSRSRARADLQKAGGANDKNTQDEFLKERADDHEKRYLNLFRYWKAKAALPDNAHLIMEDHAGADFHRETYKAYANPPAQISSIAANTGQPYAYDQLVPYLTEAQRMEEVRYMPGFWESAIYRREKPKNRWVDFNAEMAKKCKEEKEKRAAFKEEGLRNMEKGKTAVTTNDSGVDSWTSNGDPATNTCENWSGYPQHDQYQPRTYLGSEDENDTELQMVDEAMRQSPQQSGGDTW